MRIEIEGYGIEITHPDIQACKTITDLKALNIFTGGNEKGYKKLFEALKKHKPKKDDDGAEELA